MKRGQCLSSVKASAKRLGIGLFAIAYVSVAGGQVALNQHGLTGSWYDPANSGEGIELEVYPNAVAPGVALLQGSWFTFDWSLLWTEVVLQRWYTFSGAVPEGATSAKLVLYLNVDGNFNALPVTSATPVGTVVLSFNDCTSGRMEVVFNDVLSGIHSIPLTRLTPNVTCSADGMHAPNADFAYSGHWFDPVTSGQGVFFELNPLAEIVFVTWQTYGRDAQGSGIAGQRWYTGQAHFKPGSRSFPMSLYEANIGWRESAGGGSYATYSARVGTATATFIDCETATLTFAFAYGSNHGLTGTTHVSRVGPTPPDCR
jgi:hypothetical protein